MPALVKFGTRIRLAIAATLDELAAQIKAELQLQAQVIKISGAKTD